MGCGSCSSGGCSIGGCKSNGGCKTGGCNKLNSFDWLSNISDAIDFTNAFKIIEVRFKGGRKEFFTNANNLDLNIGDAVIIEIVGGGYDLGFISMQGELVRLQMRRKGVSETLPLPTIIRLAHKEDVNKYENAKARELPTLYRARAIINDLKLKMKLSDIDFQLDSKKATFYYSADDRVDFRELIKMLANEFKIRIEMKQISLRQESGRLGGIGVCGRELCCSTWLTEFKSVNTSAAKYQNLSLNPQKLSGQCGRLKCCLNYELDTYMEALKDIPEVNSPLQTKQGTATLQKTDIFRKTMWFSYNGDSNWHPVKTTDVILISELNKKNILPNTLDPNDIEENHSLSKVPVKLNSDIQKLDNRLKHKKFQKKREDQPSFNPKNQNANTKKR
jgi:cell fate regulator YaaT (PSP1 superfamily)